MLEAAVPAILALAAEIDDPLLRCQALNAAYLGPGANRDAHCLDDVGDRMRHTARAAGLLSYEALAHVILAS